jgi:phosphate transport system substrate-binding protein
VVSLRKEHVAVFERMQAGRVIGIAATLAAVLAASGCGGAGLVGAGSTLVAPLVAQWQQRFPVTYGAVGSGGGVAQIENGAVDFGASDAPLRSGEKRPGLVQLPWALSATAVAVNLPGRMQRLRLSGRVLADIYLGRVTRWNDAEIEQLNPEARLPSLRIAVLHRSDASGDTFAFTRYLTLSSARWRAEVGAGTGVGWRVGTGANGNGGVAEALLQTVGAVGYVSLAQARRSHLDLARLRNGSGRFVAPAPATIADAAAGAAFASDHSASIVDAPSGYPISTFTYVIVRKGSAKRASLETFLRYAVGAGQSVAASLSFAPLPASVRRADLAVIAGL